MSHWTKRFDKATASLREGGYFEGKQPLEELLPPDDWRLKEILKYREQSVIYEELANMQAKAQIRKLRLVLCLAIKKKRSISGAPPHKN